MKGLWKQKKRRVAEEKALSSLSLSKRLFLQTSSSKYPHKRLSLACIMWQLLLDRWMDGWIELTLQSMNQSHSVNKALCQTPSPLFAATFLSPQVCVNLSPCRESFSNRGQMDVGVLQAGDPATVTNLTNTDTRGGSDNTRCHQVKVLQHRTPQPMTREQRELDGLISPPPPPPLESGPSIPQYLLVFDYSEGFKETRCRTSTHETAPPWGLEWARQISDTGTPPPTPTQPSPRPWAHPHITTSNLLPSLTLSTSAQLLWFHMCSSLKAGWLCGALQWDDDHDRWPNTPLHFNALVFQIHLAVVNSFVLGNAG